MFGVGILTGDDPDKIDALDIYDEKLWFACNPGLGHNLRLSDFRREARRPGRARRRSGCSVGCG